MTCTGEQYDQKTNRLKKLSAVHAIYCEFSRFSVRLMQSHMSSTPSAAAKKKVSQPGRSKVKGTPGDFVLPRSASHILLHSRLLLFLATDVKALVNVWKELLRTAQLTDVTFVVGPKQKEFR